jgi:hypothetical protein
MQRAYAKVAGEMPDVNPVTVSPRNSSLLTKYFMPRGAFAVTNPFTGNITYNPDVLQGQSQDSIENIVAHEMTHSRQAQNTPWYKTVAQMFMPDEKVPEQFGAGSPLNDPYYWRPHEMEAFQAERDRAARLHQPYQQDPILGTSDINLPAQRGIDTAPSMGSPLYKKRGQ